MRRPASTARRVPNDADSERTACERHGGPRLAAAIVFAIVALDLLTKAWAVRELADGPVVDHRRRRRLPPRPQHRRRVQPVPGVHALARDRRRVVAFFLVRTVRRTRDTLLVVALSFVLGGALGNLIDRMFRSPGFLRGAVVDFVHVGSLARPSTSPTAPSRSGRSSSVVWALRSNTRRTPRRTTRPPMSPWMDEELAVPAALAGERVDRAVALLTGWTRGEVQELVANGLRARRRQARWPRAGGSRPAR